MSQHNRAVAHKSDCDNVYKTCTGSGQTKTQHGCQEVDLKIRPQSENLLAFVSFWKAADHLSSKTGPLLDPVHTRAGLTVERGGGGRMSR